MNKRKINAFTLVELLIVIALIGILSVAVLATINPIEQANKARDAKFKNDAAEVLGALERFYASQSQYPWNDLSFGGTDAIAADDNALLTSRDPRFGVIGGTVLIPDENEGGLLVSTSELKTSFTGKEPFQDSAEGTSPENIMYLYYNATNNDNYVCFQPKAGANRQSVAGEQLKCVDTVGEVIVNQGTGGCAIPDPWVYGVGSSNANFMCVPEGTIN